MLPSTGNPYAAPSAAVVSEVSPTTNTVRWGLWIGGAAVSMIALTATALYLEANDIGNIESGPHSAIVAGIGLILASFRIGRRHERMLAILLAESVNLTVWLTMLLTVKVLLPIFGDQKLRDSDYEIFAMIWAGGAVGTALVVLLSTLDQNKPTKNLPGES